MSDAERTVEQAQAQAEAAARGRRKVRTGVVVSDAMDKTVVVRISTAFRHPMYGKTVRRSGSRRHELRPLHLVSAWASGRGLVLGQRAVDGKSNEITAVPELLGALQLDGCNVTMPSRNQRELPFTCMPIPGTSTSTSAPIPKRSKYGPPASHQRTRVRTVMAATGSTPRR